MDNNSLLVQAVCVISISLVAGVGIYALGKVRKNKSNKPEVEQAVTQEPEDTDGQSVDI